MTTICLKSAGMLHTELQQLRKYTKILGYCSWETVWWWDGVMTMVMLMLLNFLVLLALWSRMARGESLKLSRTPAQSSRSRHWDRGDRSDLGWGDGWNQGNAYDSQTPATEKQLFFFLMTKSWIILSLNSHSHFLWVELEMQRILMQSKSIPAVLSVKDKGKTHLWYTSLLFAWANNLEYGTISAVGKEVKF